MMIYDPYPDRVEVKGREYELNLAYDRVLRVIDLQDAEYLTPSDKLEVQCKMLLADPDDCPDADEDKVDILKAVFDLFPKEEGKSAERFIDFHQDAKMIRTAFFRIGIDLLKDKIHFFKFMELLSDLPRDTALMRVVDIRQRPLPKPNKHNGEQIAALREAKAKVAIKYSEEESRRRFADSLKNSSVLRG
jgi:hypothetical protein